MITTPSPAPGGRLWPFGAAGFGVLLVLVGVLSYFLFFVRFPDLRDIPLLNLPLVALGVGLTGLGCRGLWAGGARLPGKLFGAGAMLIALAASGFFVLYVFVWSYDLPQVTTAPTPKAPAPDFALTDQSGRVQRLADYEGQKVVLVFYRGHW